jgi:hypothetical protein
MLTRMTEREARQYRCGQAPPETTGTEYYGALLRFKKPGSAILGLLWSREGSGGPWRIVFLPHVRKVNHSRGAASRTSRGGSYHRER